MTPVLHCKIIMHWCSTPGCGFQNSILILSILPCAGMMHFFIVEWTFEWKYTWSFSSCPKWYIISSIRFYFAIDMCSCPDAFVFICQTTVRLTGWFTISPLLSNMFTRIIILNRTPSFYFIANPCAFVVFNIIQPRREKTVLIWFGSTNSFAWI